MTQQALYDNIYEKFTGNGQSLESAIFSYFNADSSVFLEGANKQFYSELGYIEGLKTLYNIPYHPIVSSSFLKLIQEVTGLSYQILPSEIVAKTKAQQHALYIGETLKTLNIENHYSDLLLAYITGFIAHEYIWKKGSDSKPFLQKIKAIPPEYFWPTETGVNFKKSVNSHELINQTPNKFSKFVYSQFLDLSPLGDGVGKVIYYLLKQREKIECLANIFALRGATPTTVLKVTGDVKTSVVKTIIADLNKNDAWKNVALPPGLELTSLNSSLSNSDIYTALLSKNQELITEQLAGESIVGGNGVVGQRGAQEASNLRKTRAINLGLKAVTHINNHLIKPIIDYKFGAQKAYPELLYNMPQLSKLGLATITEAIQIQQQLGLEINPIWFEKNYQVDIKNLAADL